ncbi:MAG TPA: DUF721 domain-containing protein [Rhodanobacteraceae bacterium]|nr:DUF721 domain-containing protein [Rhodanobacteraceae bacterium]
MHTGSESKTPSPCDKPRQAGDCLADTGLLAHGHKLLALNRQLRRQLPPWFERSMLADVRAGRAVFMAPSPAAASRLRLEQRRLRDVLLALGEAADSILVKVRMPPRVPPAPDDRKPLSRAAAEQLRAAAASMSDPELRAQFLALASLAD